MSIQKDNILQLAKLARLSISEEEAETLTGDLSEILDYAAKLSNVETNSVEPTYQVHGATNVFREDTSSKSMSLEKISGIAPDFTPVGFRVPKVIS